MKICLSVLACVIGGYANLSFAERAEIVAVETARIFTPKHFDDNDNAAFMIDGYLPDSCYKLIRPEVTVDQATKQISVTAYARRFGSGECALVRVPFSYEVQIGVLSRGSFSIQATEGAGRASLPIAESTNAGPDDFTYAPVDVVQVQPERGRIIVDGRFTSTCMTWNRIDVFAQDDVIEILPIVDIAESGDCVEREDNYRKEIALPSGLASGRYLVHVRSLNGHSLNLLFTKD